MTVEAAQLPGYQLGESIHESSVSSVYRARRTSDGVCVAIKRSQSHPVSARQLTRCGMRNQQRGAHSLIVP